MSKRPYIGPSDSQANADALARRSAPYAEPSERSFRDSWDWHRREPSDLREAVRMVRRAYADEVPSKLHEGRNGGTPMLAADGSPRFASKAEGYIFGSASSSDARRDPETGQWDALSYFHSPFRAALDNLARGDEACQKRGLIVQHVTMGGQGPAEAAIKEGVPPWCAKLVAESVLFAFLRNLTDVKLNMGRAVAQDTTAA